VYPALTYRDIGAALTWLEEAFGSEGQVLDEAGAIVRFRSGVTVITCLLADLGRLPVSCSTVAPRENGLTRREGFGAAGWV
jgi:hypothetical protein